MNKYTELSDDAINAIVFISLYGEGSLKDKDMRRYFSRVDYCNNPADAMPIVIENLISLMADVLEDGKSPLWIAQDISANITTRYKSNPLRAAMEVFLMMKDAENEKV
ncbi:phage protein NinX family protein [Proteus mirabilis]|uniref:phage protein NinX family protein n=1 Tax=Proteus mirabilis TaxID=584 RepID=UPI00336F293F|nr:DUF2591 family protein [Proteus mirabilis]